MAYSNIPTFNNPPVYVPEIREPPLLRNPLMENMAANYASAFHQRLTDWINAFDRNLDQQHDVGLRLVSFGETVVFHLEKLGYWDPSLIVFSGHNEQGNPVELIQHVSQISILLMKLPRTNPNEPKRPIGFVEVSEKPTP